MVIIFAVICIAYPIYILIIKNGFLHYQCSFENIPNGSMATVFELSVWGVIAAFGLKRKNISWLIGIGVFFSYLHMMFLPMLIAGVYFLLPLLVVFFSWTKYLSTLEMKKYWFRRYYIAYNFICNTFTV